VLVCWCVYLSGTRCSLAYGPADAIVSCFSKIQIGFTFLVPAHTGIPRKRAVEYVCTAVSKKIKVCSYFRPHRVHCTDAACCYRFNQHGLSMFFGRLGSCLRLAARLRRMLPDALCGLSSLPTWRCSTTGLATAARRVQSVPFS